MMRGPGCLMLFATLLVAMPLVAQGQQLLDGEFGDIDLGRTLIEPSRIPTVQELRAAVRKPDIAAVLMFKLYGNKNNHYLPAWSADGLRLAFQRSDVQRHSSKLLIYPTLGRAEPLEIPSPDGAYDYQFRWGRNSTASYVFSRIEAESRGVQLYFSPGQADPAARTSGDHRHLSPALYERTDGIWRLAYEQDGRLMHEAFTSEESIESPLPLGQGSSPRWSSDGFRLLLARARGNKIGAFDIAVLNLKSEQETRLSSSPVVRSPTWSPDEQYVAWYARDAGENKPWRIEVAQVSGAGPVRQLGAEVAINVNFDSEGPAWEPACQRVWYFSHRHRQQAYYPLIAADRQRGEEVLIDYPRRCTNPNDLAINPRTRVPEMAFVAHDGLPQDLFVLFLNHY